MPARHCFRGRMIGIPPATAASKRRSTPFSFAAANSSPPCTAIRSLFAVTTFFPDCSARRIMVLAGSMPPMTSITMAMEGSFTIFSKSSVSRAGSTPSLFLWILWTRTAPISRDAPVLSASSSFLLTRSLYTPPPTVPNPRSAALIVFCVFIPSLPSFVSWGKV